MFNLRFSITYSPSKFASIEVEVPSVTTRRRSSTGETKFKKKVLRVNYLIFYLCAFINALTNRLANIASQFPTRHRCINYALINLVSFSTDWISNTILCNVTFDPTYLFIFFLR